MGHQSVRIRFRCVIIDGKPCIGIGPIPISAYVVFLKNWYVDTFFIFKKINNMYY